MRNALRSQLDPVFVDLLAGPWWNDYDLFLLSLLACAVLGLFSFATLTRWAPPPPPLQSLRLHLQELQQLEQQQTEAMQLGMDELEALPEHKERVECESELRVLRRKLRWELAGLVVSIAHALVVFVASLHVLFRIDLFPAVPNFYPAETDY
ncbi:MAG: hypothetical protein MHM6MM_004595 [Cercozoa sp. M6MM]